MKTKIVLSDLYRNVLKKMSTTGGALILISGFFSTGFVAGQHYERVINTLTLIENENNHATKVIELTNQINWLKNEIDYQSKISKKNEKKK